jgi:hypothetical protein
MFDSFEGLPPVDERDEPQRSIRQVPMLPIIMITVRPPWMECVKRSECLGFLQLNASLFQVGLIPRLRSIYPN